MMRRKEAPSIGVKTKRSVFCCGCCCELGSQYGDSPSERRPEATVASFETPDERNQVCHRSLSLSLPPSLPLTHSLLTSSRGDIDTAAVGHLLLSVMCGSWSGRISLRKGRRTVPSAHWPLLRISSSLARPRVSRRLPVCFTTSECWPKCYHPCNRSIIGSGALPICTKFSFAQLLHLSLLSGTGTFSKYLVSSSFPLISLLTSPFGSSVVSKCEEEPENSAVRQRKPKQNDEHEFVTHFQHEYSKANWVHTAKCNSLPYGVEYTRTTRPWSHIQHGASLFAHQLFSWPRFQARISQFYHISRPASQTLGGSWRKQTWGLLFVSSCMTHSENWFIFLTVSHIISDYWPLLVHLDCGPFALFPRIFYSHFVLFVLLFLQHKQASKQAFSSPLCAPISIIKRTQLKKLKKCTHYISPQKCRQVQGGESMWLLLSTNSFNIPFEVLYL